MRKPPPMLVAAAVVVVAVLVAVFASGILDGNGKADNSNNGVDNGVSTQLVAVTRRTLTQQTQVSATLGYADTSSIVVPAGTAESALLQAQQSVTTAQAQLAAARATAAADGRTLTQAEAALAAARRKLAVECAGDNAASSAASSSAGGSGATPCANDVQTVTTDEQAVTQAQAKVTTDQQSITSATASVASASTGLSQASSSATIFGQSPTFTSLPAVGAIIGRGETLYGISGQPVVLMYGSTAAWRAFRPGMSPGNDVAELNDNLRALGYGAPTGDAFTGATSAAIDAFQSAHGLAQTGSLLLGAVVFEPFEVRVTSVTPTIGTAVQPGPVLGITSTRRQVTIALDAAQQAEVKVGDPVTITLPDNSTTPGRVTYVGKVATTPSSSGSGGGSSTPTIEVDVTPTDPAATGHLDQATVNVSITTATVKNALVVPVNTLLALASGGYAVEVAGAGGARTLVAVQLGTFDDAEGYVQVTGNLTPGTRVVAPSE